MLKLAQNALNVLELLIREILILIALSALLIDGVVRSSMTCQLDLGRFDFCEVVDLSHWHAGPLDLFDDQ